MIYHFDVEDARQYGTDEAILLYNIVGWLRVNRANDRNCYDGRTWTYNTARALADVMQRIWNEDQVRRLINSLVKQGVLVKGNYNREVGRRADDRTLWLAVVDEDRLELPNGDERPAKMRQAPRKNQGSAPPPQADQPSGENAGRLPQNRRTPPAKMPDASGEFAGHIIVQKETNIGETATEKQQQQLLLLPPPAGEPDFPDQEAAAAEDFGFEEFCDVSEPMTTHERQPMTTHERDARRTMAHSLHTLGVKGVEADALAANFAPEDIQQQIGWLPYQNCENPGYWLPRYIRERWPKPKALLRQEKIAAEKAERERLGLTETEQRDQHRREKQVRAERCTAYRDNLSEEQAAELTQEAKQVLLQQQFWRDYVAAKGTESRSYAQALEGEIIKLVGCCLGPAAPEYGTKAPEYGTADLEPAGQEEA